MVRCPKCKSTNVNQFRMVTGPIWCADCGYRVEHKEIDKSFFNQTSEIPINIWDDYYDDDHIPEGKIQETFIYVEDSNISTEDQKKYLEKLFKAIKEKVTFGPNITMQVGYDDQTNKWKIFVRHLTHKRRKQMLEELQKLNLNYGELEYKIYSES